MNTKLELIKNTVIIFAGKVCTQLLSFFLLPLYTKYLISEDYGFVDLITTYLSLLIPVLSLQLEMATFRYLVDNRNNEKETQNILSSVLKILVLLVIISLTGYLILVQFIDIKYKYLIALVVFSCFFSHFFLQVARGLGKNIVYSISCCVSAVITVLGNIILIVVMKYGADGMLISMFLANAISAIYLIFSLHIPRYFKFKIYDSKLIKEFLKYSIPLIPNGVSWWVVNASDRTIISAVLGVAANGIYAVSNKFSSVFIGAFNVFQLSWSESASIHINDKDSDKFFSSTMNMVFTLCVCLCFVIIAFMPIIFKIFVDEAYDEAYNNIPILMVAMLFNVVVGLYSSLYIAKKMTRQVMNTSIVSAIINIITNLVLIKYIGLYAASISTLVAYAVMAIYRHYDMKKYVKINWNVKFFIYSIVVGSIILVLYYINSYISNLGMMLISIVYGLIFTKNSIKSFIKILKNKFLRKNKLI